MILYVKTGEVEHLQQIEESERHVEVHVGTQDSQLPDIEDVRPENEFQRISRTAARGRKKFGDQPIQPPKHTNTPVARKLEYTDDQLATIKKWITHQREGTHFDKEPNEIDPNTMTFRQRYAYNIVEECLTKQEQFLMQLLGTAGTGKSYTIAGLYHLLISLRGFPSDGWTMNPPCYAEGGR